MTAVLRKAGTGRDLGCHRCGCWEGTIVPGDQQPSIGCSIKWPGNAPEPAPQACVLPFWPIALLEYRMNYPLMGSSGIRAASRIHPRCPQREPVVRQRLQSLSGFRGRNRQISEGFATVAHRVARRIVHHGIGARTCSTCQRLTLPEIYVRASAMSSTILNPPWTIWRKVLKMDPAISARMLKIVNSPLYGFPQTRSIR